MTDKYDDREITLNNGERMTVREFLAIRKEEGLKIDPTTAEVHWHYTEVTDPYGVYPFEEIECVGRSYFARRPGSDIWVEFGDLPEKTRDALWGQHKSELAFPAGFEDAPF
jgi:hypothetical protein